MAGEVLGPKVEPASVMLLKGHAVKMPSKYVSTHRPGSLSVFVWERAAFNAEAHNWSRC